MTVECLQCKHEFEVEKFPFGDNIACPQCHAVMETDWDYTSDDSMTFWITGKGE